MRTIEQLKKWASAVRPELPTSRVIDLLVKGYRGPRCVYSPEDIRQVLGLDHPAVLATLLLLDGEPSDILRSQWAFFDEGERLDISKDQLSQILKSQQYLHPRTGEPVPGYLQSIVLIYEPGPALVELIGQ